MWEIHLREIFLHALVHIRFAMDEGPSKITKKAISDEYELIYKAPLDETSLQTVIDAVQSNPTDMSHMEYLKGGHFINEEFRSVIAFAIMEIINVDGKQSNKQKMIALEVTSFLAMNEDVALMSIDRYQNHMGPASETTNPSKEIFNGADNPHSWGII